MSGRGPYLRGEVRPALFSALSGPALWRAYHGLTRSQLDAKHKTYGRQGYYPVSVDGEYVPGQGVVYAAVWVKN
ncbi:hypothetical protein GCM10010466_19910 [Planomonospora alba]|uniref:Uncharacterized protein n=1 Tax=Planomonospora alba TaxID=161354 RepID=A0ABP6MXE4_9ACTN